MQMPGIWLYSQFSLSGILSAGDVAKGSVAGEEFLFVLARAMATRYSIGGLSLALRDEYAPCVDQIAVQDRTRGL